MKAAELLRLKALVDGALAGMEGVEFKKLFGNDAYFIGGNLFATLTKEGRLGLRLAEDSSTRGFLAPSETAPWYVGGSRVRDWVLVPTDKHSEAPHLRQLFQVAYREALRRPMKPAVTRESKPKRVRPAVFRRLD